MTTTFITGANKSLGFETARRLVDAGHTVLLGARDPERGRAAAASIGARFVRIDVTDDTSVRPPPPRTSPRTRGASTSWSTTPASSARSAPSTSTPRPT